MDYISLVKLQVIHALMNITLMNTVKDPVAAKLIILSTLPKF